MERKFFKGWKPDVPDFRDFKLKLKAPIPVPDKVDMESGFSECYDQDDLGSCTGQAIASVVEYRYLTKGLKLGTPSRLFIYFNEREMENTIKEDAGAQIRDGIKSIGKKGVCFEDMWPYDISKFAKRPPKKCYTKALDHQAIKYARVDQDEDSVLQVLAAKDPIVFGFSVYDSLMSKEVASSGILPMPSKKDKMHGGHAVTLVGYDLTKRLFKVRNSWGTDWAQKGYFWMPFDYVLDESLADDFWYIDVMENEDNGTK